MIIYVVYFCLEICDDVDLSSDSDVISYLCYIWSCKTLLTSVWSIMSWTDLLFILFIWCAKQKLESVPTLQFVPRYANCPEDTSCNLHYGWDLLLCWCCHLWWIMQGTCYVGFIFLRILLLVILILLFFFDFLSGEEQVCSEPKRLPTRRLLSYPMCYTGAS